MFAQLDLVPDINDCLAPVEFARRELAGAGLDHSLEPVVKFLKYPIQR